MCSQNSYLNLDVQTGRFVRIGSIELNKYIILMECLVLKENLHSACVLLLKGLMLGILKADAQRMSFAMMICSIFYLGLN